jgi:hypothetical protein
VGFADAVILSGIEKDTLGGGCLAGINVRHDADIAYSFERVTSGHNRQ